MSSRGGRGGRGPLPPPHQLGAAGSSASHASLPYVPPVDDDEDEVIEVAEEDAMRAVVEEAEGYKLILSSNNSTGYLGVTKQHGGNKFYAQRLVEGKVIYLGNYDTRVEAAVAVAKHGRKVSLGGA